MAGALQSFRKARRGVGKPPMMTNHKKSLELWERYGQYLLLAMPYADGLIHEARGCTLRDLDGNEILDLAAGQFCSILGHSHPKFIEKVIDQIRRVAHTGSQFLSPVVLEAAGKFAEVAPGQLKRSMIFSTGTEANECAISVAKTCTGKRGVIGFNRGYYGLSLTTKSLSSIFGGRPGDGPNVPETYRLLAPHCFHCPVNSHHPECNLLCLESSLEATVPAPDDIAAVIIEPILSAGGMIVPPPGYLKVLREFTRRHGSILIVDEAQTGFGRTGKWFGVQHHGVEPDILVISKGAGGGFPVSGFITTDEIADRVEKAGFSHLASHQLDPLSGAVLSALIDIIKEEGLVQKASETGLYFKTRLKELREKHAIVADVRGEGLMLGMEIAGNGAGGRSDAELTIAIVALCRQNRVHLTFTYFEPVLRFIPPLTLTRQEVDFATSVVDDALSRAIGKDFSLDDLMPNNRYTRAYVERQRGNWTLGRIFSRLYQTSPERWIRKFNEMVARHSE
jgi:2,2-dialkylglycine decarboxylase (pyruvate)